jgi:hypothetical protein
MSSSSHMITETDPISETLSVLVIYNSRRWPRSANPVILVRFAVCNTCYDCASFSVNSSILKMEATLPSEMSIDFQQRASRCYIPEDGTRCNGCNG